MSLINPDRAREFYESTVAQHPLHTAMELDEREAQRHKQGQGFPIQRGEIRDDVPSAATDGTATGVHWTVKPMIAKRFAEQQQMQPGRVHTIWHGVLDNREAQQQPDSVYGQPQEREITMREGSAVRVTGVSYYSPKEGDTGYPPVDPDKWEHVDFTTHPYLRATQSRTSTADDPAYQKSREKVGGSRDVWTQLAGGDTDEGVRTSRVLSPSQFAARKAVNPDYSYPDNPRKRQRYQDQVFDARSVFHGEDDFEGMPYHAPDGRIITPDGAGSKKSHVERWAKQ